MKENTKTRRLVESAMMLAIAVVLELLTKLLGLQLPFGGTFTIASMLPIILISYRYGVRWGLVTGAVYSVLQMLMGGQVISAMFIPGTDSSMVIWKAVLVLLLDYVLAYTLLGLGGVFRNKIKNPALALFAGAILALSIRYMIHIVSGAIFFGAWWEWFFTQDGMGQTGQWFANTFKEPAIYWVYSIIYNGLYMIPEIIITAITALVIGRVPQLAKKIEA